MRAKRQAALDRWLSHARRVLLRRPRSAFQRQMEDSLQRTGLGYIILLGLISLLFMTASRPCISSKALQTDSRSAPRAENTRAHLKVLEKSGFPYLQKMRSEGTIKAFGAGMNSNEKGEDRQKKRAWNKEYMNSLIKMGASSKGPHIDFILCANMLSLLNHIPKGKKGGAKITKMAFLTCARKME